MSISLIKIFTFFSALNKTSLKDALIPVSVFGVIVAIGTATYLKFSEPNIDQMNPILIDESVTIPAKIGSNGLEIKEINIKNGDILSSTENTRNTNGYGNGVIKYYFRVDNLMQDKNRVVYGNRIFDNLPEELKNPVVKPLKIFVKLQDLLDLKIVSSDLPLTGM